MLLVILLLPVASGEDYTVMVGTESDTYVFSPAVLKISPGDNVTFLWTPGMPHNVAEVDNSESLTYNDGFRSGEPQDGGEWVLPSNLTAEDGTLYYVCEPHAGMKMRGEIIIQSAPEIAMEFGDFPWLSYLLVFPLIGALWAFGFRENTNAPRIIALFTTLFTLI
ncbi:uncharacterized protein METZ01_LOCUS423462, partial [marine metagenome]